MRLEITTPNGTFGFTARDGASNIMVGNRDRDDITIEGDADVSGPHVRIERFSGDWSFTDQFSGTGTFHNGEKKYSGDLAVGDVLKVGSSELRIVSLDEASAAEPEPRMYNAHVHEPGDEMHPEPVSKKLDEASWSGYEQEYEPEPAPLPVETQPEPESKRPDRELPPDIFVDRITERLVRAFQNAHDIDIRENPLALKRVREAALKAVIEMEDSKTTSVNLPFLHADSSGPKHLEVDLHRRHLHEELPDATGHDESFVPPEVRRAKEDMHRRAQASLATRRAAAAVGGGLVIFFIVSVVFGTMWLESSDDPSAPEPEESAEVAREKRKVEEAELKAKVLLLLKDEETAPQDLMTQLNQYESRARTADFGIGWDYERVRTQLEIAVHRDVSHRYNEVAGSLFDLRKANNYRQAQANVDELANYLNSSPHNVRSMGVLDLEKTMERWRKSHYADSDRFVAEQILVAQEAVSREDYQPAAAALTAVADGALIDEEVIRACRALSDSLQSKEGEAREPFHYRDRPAKSPANDLLPSGDNTGYKRLNDHMRAVTDELKAGERREFSVWGMQVEVKGEARTSQITVTYKLDVGPGTELRGTHKSSMSNLLDAVRLALLAEDENLTIDELTGLLVFAFDNGLFSEAGEIAYRIRNVDPDSAAALDEILSVKWDTQIPEGGFPERGGRVVRE